MDYLAHNIATPEELEYFTHITLQDLVTTIHKNAEYGASWKKRGGVGAFMMLARKWDRLEEMVKRENYDIFAALRKSSDSGEALRDTIGDLRNYLTLVENEAIKIGILEKPVMYLKYSTDRHGNQNLDFYPKATETPDGAIVLPSQAPVNTTQRDKINHPAPFGHDAKDEETWEQREKRQQDNGKHM